MDEEQDDAADFKGFMDGLVLKLKSASRGCDFEDNFVIVLRVDPLHAHVVQDSISQLTNNTSKFYVVNETNKYKVEKCGFSSVVDEYVIALKGCYAKKGTAMPNYIIETRTNKITNNMWSRGVHTSRRLCKELGSKSVLVLYGGFGLDAIAHKLIEMKSIVIMDNKEKTDKMDSVMSAILSEVTEDNECEYKPAPFRKLKKKHPLYYLTSQTKLKASKESKDQDDPVQKRKAIAISTPPPKKKVKRSG